MRRLGGILSGVLSLLVIVAVMAGGAFFYLKSQFEGAGPLPREATFMVSQGEGLADIAGNLESEGIITDARLFIAGAFVNDSRHKLKAGEYLMPANVSMADILDTLVAGRSVQHKLTVPEGFTTDQVVQRVLAHPILVGEVSEMPPEGAILPDTYVFLRGMTRQKLIDRMRMAQKKVIEELWPTRAPDLPFKTPEEAIILASIVEKETGKSEERPRVASVFINRLKRRMRLQSDPTIIYGIVGGKGVLDRPLTKADIAEKTKYNTYQIDGLPPTPIANPGKAAIEAVLQPATTTDIYFVADGTGGHTFAKTLADHRKNVALWRQIEAERRRLQVAEEKARQASETASAGEPATVTGKPKDQATAAPAAAAVATPPPPPPPPSAEPADLRQQAAPAPRPKPKPSPETTGSVTVATVEQEAAVAREKPKPVSTPGSGAALTRSGIPVPKPRPKPDIRVADDEEVRAAPALIEETRPVAAPTVIRPAVPEPAPRRVLGTREGFR